MTKLTPHFTLAELTVTNTGLTNIPSGERKANLLHTALQMEKVRELLGNLPITVTSGFRSSAVNLKVGGATNSDHLSGFAVDFTRQGLSAYLTCAMIADSDLVFDQIIHEKRRWVHISFAPRNRRSVLTLLPSSKEYLQGLHK